MHLPNFMGSVRQINNKQKVALDTNLGHKKMISRKITSDEFRTHPAFKKMWDATNATQGIHWVDGKKYYAVREVNGIMYFAFEDCIVLAWRFNKLYIIPLELEERMRSIMQYETNYMAIAMATKSHDPLDVAILRTLAEDWANCSATRDGGVIDEYVYTDGKNVCVCTMDTWFVERTEIINISKYNGEIKPQKIL